MKIFSYSIAIAGVIILLVSVIALKDTAKEYFLKAGLRHPDLSIRRMTEKLLGELNLAGRTADHVVK